MDLTDKRKLFVLGFGRSGKAVTKLLAKKGYDVVVYDDSGSGAVQPTDMVSSVTAVASDAAAHALLACDCVVVSPGVPLDHALVTQAVSRGIPVTGELEIAYTFASSRIIAVTGTNGKSTVVKLIGDVLANAGHQHIVAGNIGTPFADVVDDGADTVVLEVSSFQLDAR